MADTLSSTQQGRDNRVEKGKNIQGWGPLSEIIPGKYYTVLLIKKSQSKDDRKELRANSLFQQMFLERL